MYMLRFSLFSVYFLYVDLNMVVWKSSQIFRNFIYFFLRVNTKKKPTAAQVNLSLLLFGFLSPFEANKTWHFWLNNNSNPHCAILIRPLLLQIKDLYPTIISFDRPLSGRFPESPKIHFKTASKLPKLKEYK